MVKNMIDLSRQYADLVFQADKLQADSSLSPSTMRRLAGILARISMLELQLYGEANIYCRNKSNEDPKAPF
ncbi:MAG: hypothetical protein GX660_09400 [Clostridiaceae bacterium]|jgi:hypothetical protein|nr:hypothetical protein [Clostridiaceae bacterium]